MNQTAIAQAEKQPEDAFIMREQLSGYLQSRNVRIHERRTSVRLEPEMWDALNEIATAEGCSIHDLCGAVHDLKDKNTSFTAALRVFLMEYYRSAAKTSSHVAKVQRLAKGQPLQEDEGLQVKSS